MPKPESSPFVMGRILWAALVAGCVWLVLSRGLNVPNAVLTAFRGTQLAPYLTVLSSGDDAKARAIFDADLRGHVADPNAYGLIAEACIQKSNFNLAIEYLKRGTEQCTAAPKGDQSVLFTLLASCYGEVEKTKPQQQAVLAAKRAFELSPDDPDTLNTYGYLLADNDQQLDEAVKLTARALQLLKKEPDTLKTQVNTATFEDSYGWALFRQGRYDAAVNALNQAIADIPPEALADSKIKADTLGTVYYHLGAAYRRQKRSDLARQALSTAISSAPTNKEAKSELDALNAETAAPRPTSLQPGTGAKPGGAVSSPDGAELPKSQHFGSGRTVTASAFTVPRISVSANSAGQSKSRQPK